MMKINVKRMVVHLFMLVMVMTMLPCVAFAADPALIDISTTGSITVTKYANTNESAIKGNATGMASTVDPSYTPLNGATFKLFKIANADKVMEYYNGTSAKTYNISNFQYNESTGEATYGGMAIADVWERTTMGSGPDAGKCTFTGLPVGIYVLKEVTAPSQIAAPLADPCLISIPMVNTATSSNNNNEKWMYNVYVYPKNHESTGTVELTKVQHDGVTPLAGVEFSLFKLKDNSTWEAVLNTLNNNGTPVPLTLTTDANGVIKLENLPSGLNGTQYKLVENSAPDGYIVNETPLYFKVNKDNTITWNAESGETYNNENKDVLAADQKSGDATILQIKLRNERPSLQKWVKANGGDEWKTDEQYRLDDEITYRLIAYVPNNVAKLGTYEIKDIPQIGITDSDTITDYTVTYGDTPDTCIHALSTVDYIRTTIVADGSNGQGFKLTLTDTGKTTTAGKYIQIVYKAHMNANAVIAGNGNGNTATLTYSKFIGGGDDKYTITDEARVYTYQYQITKYKDSVDNANVIANVEFKLLDQTSPERVLPVVKISEGVYRLAISTDSVTTETLVTKTDGTILIKGLENGDYYLKETKTIDGYNLLSEPFKITVNVTETTTWTSDTGYTSTGQVVKKYVSTSYNGGVTDPTGTSTIINKKGFVLPQTGGMGYLLFCTVGILLIGGGAALIFGGRRKKIR